MDVLDRAAYYAVIRSARWRALKARLLRERGVRCERCGKTWAPGYKTDLQLHHKTYERLGHECDGDVQLVCAYCHEHADDERAAESRARAEAALYDARLDGWASARYGEDWDERSWDARQDIEDAFDRFLEDHDGHD